MRGMITIGILSAALVGCTSTETATTEAPASSSPKRPTITVPTTIKSEKVNHVWFMGGRDPATGHPNKKVNVSGSTMEVPAGYRKSGLYCYANKANKLLKCNKPLKVNGRRVQL